MKKGNSEELPCAVIAFDYENGRGFGAVDGLPER